MLIKASIFLINMLKIFSDKLRGGVVVLVRHAIARLYAGAVQREHALRFLGARPCEFAPQHKNKLGAFFDIFQLDT